MDGKYGMYMTIALRIFRYTDNLFITITDLHIIFSFSKSFLFLFDFDA